MLRPSLISNVFINNLAPFNNASLGKLGRFIILPTFSNFQYPEFYYYYFFLGLHPQHTEVPSLGVKSESRAAAAGLRHSHSKAGTELNVRPTPQLTEMPDP